MLGRVWQLRADVTAHDASCVALAEALGCGAVTADARMSRAPGLRCAITAVPRWRTGEEAPREASRV
ncbi:hypothetical protein [Quadrisphaera sp. DSM 44207]|uniref:hypothetical protein n=1 Tax=Quadrisphaera sp. DSM 44207 TaxID=1881057 RepID=UPI00115FA362|nr:hypothetical protein [Quadrisphaera sp. DSM 44207]